MSKYCTTLHHPRLVILLFTFHTHLYLSPFSHINEMASKGVHLFIGYGGLWREDMSAPPKPSNINIYLYIVLFLVTISSGIIYKKITGHEL
jgi:hypothetical protein